MQSIYLTEVPPLFAEVLIGLIGAEGSSIAGAGASAEISAQSVNSDLEVWEHHLENEVENDPRIDATDREALITARHGQGLFKQRVMPIEN